MVNTVLLVTTNGMGKADENLQQAVKAEKVITI
jgi:hypothetical protein